MTVPTPSHPDYRRPRRILSAVLLTAAALAPLTALAQTKFMEPTHDELTMTSLPGYPGVAAVDGTGAPGFRPAGGDVLNGEDVGKR